MLIRKLTNKIRRVLNGELTRNDLWWFVPAFIVFSVLTGLGVQHMGDAL